MNFSADAIKNKILAPIACLGISSIFITGVCFISLVLALSYPNCLPNECAPERTFQLEELTLPAKYFPENAQVNELHPMNGKEGAEEAVITTNYWDGVGGLAIHQVYRFATVEGAGEKYSFTIRSFFFHNRDNL